MKKIIAMFSVLLYAAVLLISCVPQETESEDISEISAQESGTSGEQTVDDYVRALIGDRKYDKTFTIISVDSFNLEYMPYYFVPEEYNNEPFNDAAYERNLKVEELLGVKLEFMATGGGGTELPDTVKTQIEGGTRTFDLIAPHSAFGVLSLMTDGMLLDWKSVDIVDMTKDWWYGDALGQLSICGISAWAVSDFTIGQQVPFWIVFNREMAENYGKGNLYETVLEGKWTLDTMAQTIKDVTVTGGETDRYGAALFADDLWYVVGSDAHPCTKSGDDGLLFTPDTERLSGILEKMTAMTTAGDAVVIPYDANKYKDFSDGKVFLQTFNGAHYSMMRTFNLDMGILPIPKYDEDQDDYVSLSCSGLMGLPIDTDDTSYAGLVVEVLSALSHETVRPAFIETVLYNQCLRDDGSQQMMDILLRTQKYYYENADVRAMLTEILSTGKVQSVIDARRTVIETGLKQIEDGIKKANQ